MEAFDWLKQVGTVPSCFKFTLATGYKHYVVNFDIFEYTWQFVQHIAVFCDGMKNSTSVFKTLTSVFDIYIYIYGSQIWVS